LEVGLQLNHTESKNTTIITVTTNTKRTKDNFHRFSRSYCYTVGLRSAIGIIMSSVRLSACNAVHCGSQCRCTGLKVVPACS